MEFKNAGTLLFVFFSRCPIAYRAADPCAAPSQSLLLFFPRTCRPQPHKSKNLLFNPANKSRKLFHQINPNPIKVRKACTSSNPRHNLIQRGTNVQFWSSNSPRSDRIETGNPIRWVRGWLDHFMPNSRAKNQVVISRGCDWWNALCSDIELCQKKQRNPLWLIGGYDRLN